MTKAGARPEARIAGLLCALGMGVSVPASAQNIVNLAYDAATNQLVATIAYQGTNPNHKFKLDWGPCETLYGAVPNAASAEVTDEQWTDIAERDFTVHARFALGGFPCRPALVTLRIGQRVTRTTLVP